MSRKLTCILCPRGCTLEVTEELTVSGNACPRGGQYAVNECTNPVRTVTATVRVKNRVDMMLPVKTVTPVPKGKMREVMALLRRTSVTAPVAIGTVILPDVLGTDIIATGKVD